MVSRQGGISDFFLTFTKSGVTMKQKKVFLMFFVCGLFISSLSFCSEILLPATQMEKGKGAIQVIYSETSRKLSFTQTGSQKISVSGHDYYSDVATKFDTDAKASMVAVRWVYGKELDSLFWVKLGRGNYEIEVPSATVKNRLSGRDASWVGGAGLRKLLFPDTVVTPAVAVDFGANIGVYKIDSFKPGDSADELVSNELMVAELQAAVVVSKNYSVFEPYAAVKISKTQSSLKDNDTIAKIDGSDNTVGLTVGTKLKIFKKDSLTLEGSFIGENSVTASWNTEF